LSDSVTKSFTVVSDVMCRPLIRSASLRIASARAARYVSSLVCAFLWSASGSAALAAHPHGQGGGFVLESR